MVFSLLLYMLQKTVGIVLRCIKYNDSMNIVDVYTKLSGRASFLVRISRSRKSNVKSVLFQPLSFIEFEADFRAKSSIYPIRNAKVWIPFQSIPYAPYKSTMALFLSEFLYRALKEEEGNEALFAYLENSILWLDTCKSNFSNFHLVFLMRLSRFLGLYPNLSQYREGAYFDMLNAQFSSSLPAHSAYLNVEESARVPLLMRINYKTMHLVRMNRSQRDRCLFLINDYYRLHLPDFPVLKSLDVLKAIFE